MFFQFTNYSVTGDDKLHKQAGLGQSWSYIPDVQLMFHYDLSDSTRYVVLSKSNQKVSLLLCVLFTS
jgi:hypothetical protein